MPGKRDNIEIKVLGIGASPLKGGSTDTLLDRALEGARSCGAVTEKIVLNDLHFVPCQECGGCSNSGVCIHRDDMADMYEKVEKADVIVLASPIFFANLTAQAKAFIDRFHCVWVSKNALGKTLTSISKKGAFICVSAVEKKAYFENARSIIRALFTTIGVTYTSELYCGGISKTEDVLKDKQLINKAFVLGKSLCDFHTKVNL